MAKRSRWVYSLDLFSADIKKQPYKATASMVPDYDAIKVTPRQQRRLIKKIHKAGVTLTRGNGIHRYSP